jgi:hypothetical protein
MSNIAAVEKTPIIGKFLPIIAARNEAGAAQGDSGRISAAGGGVAVGFSEERALARRSGVAANEIKPCISAWSQARAGVAQGAVPAMDGRDPPDAAERRQKLMKTAGGAGVAHNSAPISSESTREEF